MYNYFYYDENTRIIVKFLDSYVETNFKLFKHSTEIIFMQINQQDVVRMRHVCNRVEYIDKTNVFSDIL